MALTEWVKNSGVKLNQGAAPISGLKALTEFFNVGDGKRPAGDWRKEVMALNTEERKALALDIADVTGWDVKVG